VRDLGITVDHARIDLSATMRWKDAIVGRLRDGVAALLARGQVDVIRAPLRSSTLTRSAPTSADGTHTLTTGSLIVATGSHPVELPGCPSATAFCRRPMPWHSLRCRTALSSSARVHRP